MKPVTLHKPDLALIALTRGILGAGIGLVLGGKLAADQRKAVGWASVGVGVVTTFPLIAEVLASSSSCAKSGA